MIRLLISFFLPRDDLKRKPLHDLTHLNDFHCIGHAINPVLITFGDDCHVPGFQQTPALQYTDRFALDFISLVAGNVEKQMPG